MVVLAVLTCPCCRLVLGSSCLVLGSWSTLFCEPCRFLTQPHKIQSNEVDRTWRSHHQPSSSVPTSSTEVPSEGESATEKRGFVPFFSAVVLSTPLACTELTYEKAFRNESHWLRVVTWNSDPLRTVCKKAGSKRGFVQVVAHSSLSFGSRSG